MAFNSNIKGYMTFGKSFSRGAAFPLEAYEIWTDYDALVAYAANTDPNKDPSYIGQKVAYVDLENNKVTHYGIEIDGSLKELGAAPIGDGKSISIDANGAISLLGVENADSLTLPRMKEDKSGIEWVPVSQVVEGDGNDNTTYTFTPVTKGEGEDAETYGFIVKTFFNGVAVEDGEFTIGFDVYTKSEVDAAIKVVADLVGIPAEDDDSTDTLYERIAAEILRATNAESALSDRIGAAKDGETAATGVYAYVDGVVNALVEGVDPDKIDSLNELIAWVEAHPDIVSGLDERLLAVEGVLEGFGAEDEPKTVKGYVDDTFATKQEITDAGYAVATDVERDYAKKATTLAGYGITDAYTKTEIDNKIGTPGVPELKDSEGTVTQEAVDGTGIFANAYSKAEVNALLDQVSGGSSETAASVKRQLDEYKSANNERVAAIETQVGKDVNGEEPATGLFLEIDEARAQADKGVADAKAANDAIATLTGAGGRFETIEANVINLQTTTKGHGETLADHAKRVAAIEASMADGGALDLRIDALEGFKQTQTEVNTALNTAINTTLPEAIAKKLDASEISKYSTTEAMNAAIENATKDKLVAADLADYAKSADVAATYATITALENIYKAGVDGADATGLLAEEIARAKAAEKDLDDAIKLLTNGAGTDEIDSVKELIDYVNNHGATVEGINDRLDGHDAILAGIGGTDEPATVLEAIQAAAYNLPVATASTLGGVLSAQDIELDGVATPVANAIYVDNAGNMTAKKITTDILANGVEEFIINGGNANVTTA